MSDNWALAVSNLREDVQRMHDAREAGLTMSRKLVQTCSKVIRNVHRHQFDEARKLLLEATQLAENARASLKEFPNLYYAGYLQDAEKELVEAALVLAIVEEKPFPNSAELGVAPFTYLHGAGEAASEVRRYALDELRAGRGDNAEMILAQMELIYDDLITFDYPDGMTGGLRRTTDALRAVIERTRSDLTSTVVQQRLSVQLSQLSDQLESRQ